RTVRDRRCTFQVDRPTPDPGTRNGSLKHKKTGGTIACRRSRHNLDLASVKPRSTSRESCPPYPAGDRGFAGSSGKTRAAAPLPLRWRLLARSKITPRQADAALHKIRPLSACESPDLPALVSPPIVPLLPPLSTPRPGWLSDRRRVWYRCRCR